MDDRGADAVREQTLVTVTLEQIRSELPFPLLGLDVDNDSAFINSTLVGYCKQHGIELTRSRAYKKNDQAWIEQKNGSVVRKMVGYGRLEGMRAVAELAELHRAARLYVNFFLPSFKLQTRSKGARLSRQYDKPQTPYQRLLASDRITDQMKEPLRQTFAELDPIRLLHRIREAQGRIAELEIGGAPVEQLPANRVWTSSCATWRLPGRAARSAPLTANGQWHLDGGELAKTHLKTCGRQCGTG